MRTLLESVVAEGGGKKAYIEGYRIGGKTATSQTLPRSAHKYIASFIGFVPADDPQVIGMVVIHNPQGVYYGGTIAAPVLRSIYDNVLPYLGIERAAVPEEEKSLISDNVPVPQCFDGPDAVRRIVWLPEQQIKK